MRTSIAGATFLLLGAGAAAVGAADTNGDNLALNGSDTLFKVTNDVINTCSTQLAGHGISYVGGGSGTAAGAMGTNPANQKLGPMSRNLKSGEYCSLSANGSSNTTTEGLLIGLDACSNFAGTENACSTSLADAGRTFKYPDPATGPSTYTVASSLDVLRLIYGGLDNTGAYNCAGDIRKSLVKQWSKLFSTDCAAGKCDGSTNGNGTVQPVGLTHAWRRSDLSGTTDAFVSLVGFAGRGIGGNPLIANAAPAQNPFCNTPDANDNTGATKTLGGQGDYKDKDPIRTPCDDNDTICELDGTLGLVLPVLLPDVSGVTAADEYPTNSGAACTSCVLSKTGDPTLACPKGGPKKLGRCYQPATSTGDLHCNANLSKKCFGDATGDGRVYNLPIKTVQGSEKGQYLLDSNGNLATGAFYRIHQTAGATYSANNQTCQQPDDTAQIGCLTGADPCSMGFAGREGDQQPNNQALATNGLLPTNQNALNLLDGKEFCDATHTCAAGESCNLIFKQCFPTGEVVYPITRKLWVNTIFGFENLQGGEAVLAACFGDNNNSGTAIVNRNFVKLPSPGVKCVDYDETASSTLFPLQGQPGCGLSGTNVDACANNPASLITHPY
jgi:ABC-type phosphate transport system substrate-binding protein